MLRGWKEFHKKIDTANPAPYDETPQYRHFMLWFPPLLLVSYVVASYWITLKFKGNLASIAAILERDAPIFKSRIAFLGGVDSISTASLTSTVVVGVLFAPVALAFHLFFYWKTSFRYGGYRPATSFSVIFLIRGWVLFSIFFWILFIDVPTSGYSAHVGMAAIFRWPIFPIFGSVVGWIAEGWVFCVLVGALKASRSMWGKA